MNLMCADTQTMISTKYAAKESYPNTYPWFLELKEQGLNLLSITMDGHLKVIDAIKSVWPKAKIQRCLYHIQRQGLQWLRTYPKTQAGRELRILLSKLTSIKSFKERDIWDNAYRIWLERYSNFVKSLPRTSVAFIDLKRTMGLINNALPDMPHYLKDPKIPATTNLLESFYSRLKADYQRHRGMSKQHKVAYLKWYCHFKNSNTF